jgi:hypothetical protein
MHKGLVWATAFVLLAIAGGVVWSHRHHVAEAVAAPAGVPAGAPVATGTEAAADEPLAYPESTEAQQMVTITGPLANYMAKQNPKEMQKLAPSVVETSSGADAGTEAATRSGYLPQASEHVGDSPVGTSTPLLHKTFPVIALVNLPFDIPAHAAMPLLRGTYSTVEGDVEFLLLNREQYADLLSGHPREAVFAAEDARSQEVNTGLPPTMDRPARYYLVFRNNSKGKKLVQADFRVDY